MGHVLRREVESSRYRRQRATLAVQLPQPPRVHRRRGRGLRQAVVQRQPHLGRAGSNEPEDGAMSDTTVSAIEVNGVTLQVHSAGDPADPTVVLSHGFPELAYSWRHQMAPLAEAGFHVIAPDQRGCGQSSAPTEITDYGIGNLTGDLLGLLDHFGKDDATFVGHDWGALIVWDLARLHP